MGDKDISGNQASIAEAEARGGNKDTNKKGEQNTTLETWTGLLALAQARSKKGRYSICI
jgi:hypothetical protein